MSQISTYKFFLRKFYYFSLGSISSGRMIDVFFDMSPIGKLSSVEINITFVHRCYTLNHFLQRLSSGLALFGKLVDARYCTCEVAAAARRHGSVVRSACVSSRLPVIRRCSPL